MAKIIPFDRQHSLLENDRSQKPLYRRSDVSFCEVPVNEMAHALTYFVDAANMELRSSLIPRTKGRRIRLSECERFFIKLSVCNISERVPAQTASANEEGLFRSFVTLWNHYEGYGLRRSICARVLGFYYLMERTGGWPLQGWMELSRDRPEAVLLDLAVVDGLASVQLEFSGRLSQALLLARIESEMTPYLG
jgi:hypothetical protein